MLSPSEINENQKKYMIKSWSTQGGYNPKVIVSAKGSYFTDSDGKDYLDFSSQLMCSNLGHSHPDIIEGIKKQTEKLCYVHAGFGTEPVAELSKLVAEITPGDLSKTFFSSSGCEANEAALKAARFYTGGHKIISRYRSYHGGTFGAVAITGDPRRWYTEPMQMPGVIFAPDAYCYRCPFSLKYPECGLQCAEYVDYMIEYEGGAQGKVAAVVTEPIVGSNGIIVPPDGYFKRLREICDKWGVLMIDDEVMAGFGRTGKWFAINHWDVVPDIMTMAKGITGAHIPLGATVLSKKIADHFDENLFCHGHTYVSHPLPCAAGVAAINAYKKHDVIENAAKMGKILGKRLMELKEDHKCVGDVRGKGVFWGVEPVKNRETKEPFARVHQKFEASTINKMLGEAMKKGVYIIHVINTIIVAPPCTTNEEEIEKGCDVLDEVLKIGDKEVK